jgi:hypothetical protein
MEWILGFAGIAFLTIGLIGQAFEMRKIRLRVYRDETRRTSSGMLYLELESFYG